MCLHHLHMYSEHGADQKDDGPALAGALSRVLCLLHRIQLRQPPLREVQRKARVLCIQATPDISAQYIAFMNAIFSAQVRMCIVDMCNIIHHKITS